jgi:2,4-diketo-3-deoxy-L-fuconate hydrolase
LKIVSFNDKHPRAGIVIGDRVLDINSAQKFLPSSVDEILRRGLLPSIKNIADNAAGLSRSNFLMLKNLSLFPPITSPGKVICLGRNYARHATEGGMKPPYNPTLFSKAPTSLTGPYDDIIIRPGVEKVDAEAELAVVISRAGTMIPSDIAMDYVAGFMVFNDVTTRKAQKEDGQWFRAKSYDTFAPCGPWIVTPHEIGDHQNLYINQKLNGNIIQESNTSEMIFPVNQLISYISSVMTLMPGDIIATGTAGGVGAFRDPPVFLKDGDVVEIEIERIGMIKNKVILLKD